MPYRSPVQPLWTWCTSALQGIGCSMVHPAVLSWQLWRFMELELSFRISGIAPFLQDSGGMTLGSPPLWYHMEGVVTSSTQGILGLWLSALLNGLRTRRNWSDGWLCLVEYIQPSFFWLIRYIIRSICSLGCSLLAGAGISLIGIKRLSTHSLLRFMLGCIACSLSSRKRRKWLLNSFRSQLSHEVWI